MHALDDASKRRTQLACNRHPFGCGRLPFLRASHPLEDDIRHFDAGDFIRHVLGVTGTLERPETHDDRQTCRPNPFVETLEGLQIEDRPRDGILRAGLHLELETSDFGVEILELSVRLGGTITGEHGVGVEKIAQMCVQFTDAERAQFHAVKRAFDPAGLLNPDKAIPTLHRCAEYGRMKVSGGRLRFAELERF